MPNLPRVFAAVALVAEAAQQFGRAETLMLMSKGLPITEEESARLTTEYATWKDRLRNRQSQLDRFLREDYL